MNANHEILSLRNAMDRLFQDSFTRMTQREPGNGFDEQYLVPRADAWEGEEEVTIELALPGVNPDDVDITFEQDTVTIQGRYPHQEADKNWILRERPRGPFRRRFSLNIPVAVDKVEATYHNGLLVLTLPKSEASKPRKIEVKAATS